MLSESIKDFRLFYTYTSPIDFTLYRDFTDKLSGRVLNSVHFTNFKISQHSFVRILEAFYKWSTIVLDKCSFHHIDWDGTQIWTEKEFKINLLSFVNSSGLTLNDFMNIMILLKQNQTLRTSLTIIDLRSTSIAKEINRRQSFSSIDKNLGKQIIAPCEKSKIIIKTIAENHGFNNLTVCI